VKWSGKNDDRVLTKGEKNMSDKDKPLFDKFHRINMRKEYIKELEEVTNTISGINFILNMKNWVYVSNKIEDYDWMEGIK